MLKKYSREYNILYVTNSLYAPIVAVSMVSYLRHNPGNKTCFYICETDLTDNDKRYMEDIVVVYDAEVKFINCSHIINRIKKMQINSFKGKYITYIRLFMGELLPEKVSKVLYLDADTIILDSVESVFTLDMEDKMIAGAKDWISDKYKTAIGYKGNSYINAGIMLVNLEIWRKQNCGEEIYERMMNGKRIYGFADQDIINLMFFEKIMLLDARYCAFFPLYSWDAHYINELIGKNVYSDEELKRVRENTCIVHMTGAVVSQPWVKGNKNRFSDEWMDCLQETGFEKEFQMRKNNNTLQWKLFNLTGYRIMPFQLWFAVYKKRNEKLFERLIAKVGTNV